MNLLQTSPVHRRKYYTVKDELGAKADTAPQ